MDGCVTISVPKFEDKISFSYSLQVSRIIDISIGDLYVLLMGYAGRFESFANHCLLQKTCLVSKFLVAGK
jgi:hypothetical protein